MNYFTARFPYFLAAAAGVISGVYIFQPALEEIARNSQEMEAKHRIAKMEESQRAAAAAAASADGSVASASPSSVSSQ
ncbi:hypothetical protein H9P43_006782 [Blastocladiella emersonii ATCC 22665]|nr:hypothetical protein H9P43_006782 [Blastocladiella emersonii ATCC 22665]